MTGGGYPRNVRASRDVTSAAPVALCEEVHRTYRTATSTVPALKGVDARLYPGELCAVVGPSGSGKSTLLRLLAGLDVPTSGRVEVAGETISELPRARRRALRRRKLSYVFQKASDNLVSYLSAAEHLEGAALLRAADPAEGDELLELLGIAARRDNLPHELSGGEQARLAFAAAVVGRPALVLADEPTAELDHATAGPLLEAIRGLAERGSAIVVATHDPAVAAAAHRRYEIVDGELVR